MKHLNVKFHEKDWMGFSDPMPILMLFVNGGVESFAILAAVLVCIEMSIVDTNSHSSTINEDGNDRVAVPVLTDMVSKDGRGRVEV